MVITLICLHSPGPHSLRKFQQSTFQQRVKQTPVPCTTSFNAAIHLHPGWQSIEYNQSYHTSDPYVLIRPHLNQPNKRTYIDNSSQPRTLSAKFYSMITAKPNFQTFSVHFRPSQYTFKIFVKFQFILKFPCNSSIYSFIYLFIKNICVCNAQLMQKAQQRRYKTVAAIWTKKFSIPSGNS